MFKFKFTIEVSNGASVKVNELFPSAQPYPSDRQCKLTTSHVATKFVIRDVAWIEVARRLTSNNVPFELTCAEFTFDHSDNIAFDKVYARILETIPIQHTYGANGVVASSTISQSHRQLKISIDKHGSGLTLVLLQCLRVSID